MIWEWLKALLYGIVEGITEWLPISSTGHLILFGELIPFRFSSDAALVSEFRELFDVVIQFGAVLAVLILMRERLFPLSKGKTDDKKRYTCCKSADVWRLWRNILIACLPAALIGVAGDWLLERWTGKDLDGWLYHAVVVAVALIVYGVAFLLIERRSKASRTDALESITPLQALSVGLFQALSLIPGTSRSGATILGAMLLGFSRTCAAEFSFLMAIPVMLGASAVKVAGFVSYLCESGTMLPLHAWVALLIGCLTSFAVSLVTVGFLMDFVKKHSFAAFGVYRIALGAVVLIWWLLRK